jgi:hypothetical protein
MGSISKRKQSAEGGAGWFRLGGNFVFIYVLLGLLVFYILSVQLGAGSLSEEVFAVGNIIVEALLVFYLIRNGRRGSEKA